MSKKRLGIFLICALLGLSAVSFFYVIHRNPTSLIQSSPSTLHTTYASLAPTVSTTTPTPTVAIIPYSGKIYHIFFHSLVLYPNLAFKNDAKGKIYKAYMITQREFKKILDSLYTHNFVLVDITSLYGKDAEGKVFAKKLSLPKGKKPLIISLDDLNYYSFMKGRGFADKLVLDHDTTITTEVVTPEGKVTITHDGDVVPILDDFVRKHPDFSPFGVKGVIALTGFEGVLGYRTQDPTAPGYADDFREAKKVIARLKQTGWRFASHSYSHDHAFQRGTVSLAAVKDDTQRWRAQVGSLVGDTDIFIGPFGQIFKPHDERSKYLVSQGFTMLCAVGMDDYLQYFPDHVAMDRADIDGYRIAHSSKALEPYFESSMVE